MPPTTDQVDFNILYLLHGTRCQERLTTFARLAITRDAALLLLLLNRKRWYSKIAKKTPIQTFFMTNIHKHLSFQYCQFSRKTLTERICVPVNISTVIVWIQILRALYDSMSKTGNGICQRTRGHFTLRCNSWGWGPPPPSMSKRTLLKRATANCCSYTRPKPFITSVVRPGTHKLHLQACITLDDIFIPATGFFSGFFLPILKVKK